MARPPQPGDEGCQRVACHPLTNLFRTAPKPKRETAPGGAALASRRGVAPPGDGKVPLLPAKDRWDTNYVLEQGDGDDPG